MVPCSFVRLPGGALLLWSPLSPTVLPAVSPGTFVSPPQLWADLAAKAGPVVGAKILRRLTAVNTKTRRKRKVFMEASPRGLYLVRCKKPFLPQTRRAQRKEREKEKENPRGTFSLSELRALCG